MSDANPDEKLLEAYMEAVEGTGPQTTLLALLEEAGINLPAPEELADHELSVVLWRVIEALAEEGAFLDSTDHLSDRELYTILMRDTLRAEHPVVPKEFQMVTCLDILGGWSNEDIQTYLRYYADDRERQKLAAEWNQSIPEHVDPPYRRDHLLPKPSKTNED
jgi:hypothetical protein